MAYPECMKGEGPIYDTLTKIVEDEFFSAGRDLLDQGSGERQRVKDPPRRKPLDRRIRGQPCLLSQKLNLNAFGSDGAEEGRGPGEGLHRRSDEVGAGAVAVLTDRIRARVARRRLDCWSTQ